MMSGRSVCWLGLPNRAARLRRARDLGQGGGDRGRPARSRDAHGPGAGRAARQGLSLSARAATIPPLSRSSRTLPVSDFLPLHRHGIPVNLPYPDDTFISALPGSPDRAHRGRDRLLSQQACRASRSRLPDRGSNPRRGEPSYLYRVNWIWGAVVLWMREHDPRKAEQADAGLRTRDKQTRPGEVLPRAVLLLVPWLPRHATSAKDWGSDSRPTLAMIETEGVEHGTGTWAGIWILWRKERVSSSVQSAGNRVPVAGQKGHFLG